MQRWEGAGEGASPGAEASSTPPADRHARRQPRDEEPTPVEFSNEYPQFVANYNVNNNHNAAINPSRCECRL